MSEVGSDDKGNINANGVIKQEKDDDKRKQEEEEDTVQSLISEIIHWQAKTALMKRRKRYVCVFCVVI